MRASRICRERERLVQREQAWNRLRDEAIKNKGSISHLPASVLAPIPPAAPLIDLSAFDDDVMNGFGNGMHGQGCPQPQDTSFGSTGSVGFPSYGGPEPNVNDPQQFAQQQHMMQYSQAPHPNQQPPYHTDQPMPGRVDDQHSDMQKQFPETSRQQVQAGQQGPQQHLR